MALTEIKTDREHYWLNENGNYQWEYKSWHDNGQIASHRHYNDGILDGEYKEWHENGQPASHFYCKDNSVWGELKRWDENGVLVSHYVFADNGALAIADPAELSDKDKFQLTLRYDLKWL